MSRIVARSGITARAAGQYPKKRALCAQLARDTGRHFVGIVGGRGMGKTVLLKQLLASLPKAFYISVDALSGEDLFGTAKRLTEQLGVEHLFLDEVHAHPAFDEVLKKIYDFLDLKVYFTSSVALAMLRTTRDLSRRVRLMTLPPFSFREYLRFARDVETPPLTVARLFTGIVADAKLIFSHDDRLDAMRRPLFSIGLVGEAV